MCRAAVIHNVDDIYEDCNGPSPFLLLHWRLARFVLPGPGLDLSRRPRASVARPVRQLQAETYGFLMPRRPIRNRKLTRAGAKNRSSKEAIMLDIAFVALGFAV